jgi:NAD(P)H-dependent FMN reductase
MAGKPVMILGVSLGMMGSSNAQEDLREILLSPDLAATVLPGNEVLISYANRNFNQNTGELTSEKFIKQLDIAFAHFLDYIETGWRK